MTQIAIRHTADSLENRVNAFAIENVELSFTVGRDPMADVYYDPEKEDVVSRQHAALLHNTAKERRRLRAQYAMRNGDRKRALVYWRESKQRSHQLWCTDDPLLSGQCGGISKNPIKRG